MLNMQTLKQLNLKRSERKKHQNSKLDNPEKVEKEVATEVVVVVTEKTEAATEEAEVATEVVPETTGKVVIITINKESRQKKKRRLKLQK